MLAFKMPIKNAFLIGILAFKHLKCSFNKFIYGEKLPWEDIDKYLAEKPFPFKWIELFISDIEQLSKFKMDRECNNNVTTPII